MTDKPANVKGSHSIFIGDKIERSVEIIAEESDETTSWELLNAYADENLDVEVELRGNYLRVSVDTGESS